MLCKAANHSDQLFCTLVAPQVMAVITICILMTPLAEYTHICACTGLRVLSKAATGGDSTPAAGADTRGGRENSYALSVLVCQIIWPQLIPMIPSYCTFPSHAKVGHLPNTATSAGCHRLATTRLNSQACLPCLSASLK